MTGLGGRANAGTAVAATVSTAIETGALIQNAHRQLR